MIQKLTYLFRSAVRFPSGITCPNCQSRRAIKVDQKYIVTRLFECEDCYLQFRHPVDSKNFSKSFYQSDYVQKDELTTDLPSRQELDALLRTNFVGSNKNVKRVIDLFKALVRNLEGLRIIDYGCSWGYMTYQFANEGLSVQGFEVSRPRASFGNTNLRLSIKTDTRDLLPGNDILFSSHVIEHVPSIPEMIGEAKRLLNPEGLFIAESPNGSNGFRQRNFSAFHQAWGLVHPNCLSDRFYQTLFKYNPYFITSSPYDLEVIKKWDGKSQIIHRTDGPQLLVVSKPNAIATQ